jgi:hypothetical protein
MKRGSIARGVMKHAEQTAVKQDEQPVYPKANTRRMKQQVQKIMPVLRIYHHLYKCSDKMECHVQVNIIKFNVWQKC